MKTSVLVLLVATALNVCCFGDSILQDPTVQTREPPSIPPGVPFAIPVASLPYMFTLPCDLTDDCVFQNESPFSWFTLFVIPGHPISQVTCSGTGCSADPSSGVITLVTDVRHNQFLELKFIGFARGTTYTLSSTSVVIPEPQTTTPVCGALLAFCLITCRRARYRAG
ncbi:MAG: hypothetical protein JO061_03020 [Acidobacteriaceae bacterium]|nr:hypothetical protein [Acidobacteriaceae bacterium]